MWSFDSRDHSKDQVKVTTTCTHQNVRVDDSGRQHETEEETRSHGAAGGALEQHNDRTNQATVRQTTAVNSNIIACDL